MPTDKDLNQLIINKLTQQQYNSIQNPSEDELWMLTDGKVSADDVDDTNSTNKFTTANEKQTWDAKYDKPSGGIPDTDLSSAVQTSLIKAETYTGTITGITMNGTSKGTSGVVDLGTVITEHQDITGKQNITDNTLTTINKTVPTAINEVNSIAKGANQSLSYSNYSAMVTVFNSLEDNVYNVGQNVMIVTLEVPDLWVSSIESTSSTYTYVDDASIINALETDGYIQVGYYKLSALETQKVDLTNYALKSEVPDDLSDLNDDSTHRLVTDTEKTTWNNKGTYSKPSGGIPSTDMSSAVQTSLGKADTALQSETYTGTITGITMNGVSKGTSGVVDLGTVITDVSGKVDKETGKGLSTNDFTSTYKDNVDANTTARHTHSNKSVLDTITGLKTINNESIIGSGNIDTLSQPVNTLSGTSITLTDNSINTLTPTGNTAFTLPTITDTTIFHQILVQINLSTVYTIDLGTTKYFNSTAPDLSNAGNYNLIYEYDNALSSWVVGCLSKGASS